jgi:hypothetical protein
MASSGNKPTRVVNDNIHGDIGLTDDEWKVVNTATFQRLRSLKQLGMGHLVYPNATHTRFAHSLGVFRIMCRVLENLDHSDLDERRKADLRLAALLHDIGHYPYSHLMERVAHVTLTEEEIAKTDAKTISGELNDYPDHEELGRHIIESQADIRKALGGKPRARKIGALFSRLEGTDQQLSKLIHSSLDIIIKTLASCLVERRPPRLLVEVGGVEEKISDYTAGTVFKQKCREGLEALAKKHNLQVGQFLLCGPKPIKFEERGSMFSRADAEKLKPEEREELIMVFRKGNSEPQSIVDIGGSIIRSLSNQVFSIQRLYLVERDLKPEKLEQIRIKVREWANPPK